MTYNVLSGTLSLYTTTTTDRLCESWVIKYDPISALVSRFLYCRNIVITKAQ